MGMLDKIQISRRMCPVIFLIDTSGSMNLNSGSGENPIGAVNAAIEGVLPELISMNESNADNEIKVAIMSFDFEAKWVTGETDLISPEDLKSKWIDLNADGLTSMGAAFRELNQKLSVSHGFMKRATGSVAPVLFLLSDGEPTDDYQSGLQELKKNNWYKVAVRVAIGYGDSNDDVLREFTGNSETVLHTNDPKDLKKMIHFVAITSSRVASTGGNAISPEDNSVDPDDNTQKTAAALQSQGGILNAKPDESWD